MDKNDAKASDKVEPKATIKVQDLEEAQADLKGSHVGAFARDTIQSLIQSAGSHVGAFASITRIEVTPPEALKLKESREKKEGGEQGKKGG
jgi:hypothetical protein